MGEESVDGHSVDVDGAEFVVLAVVPGDLFRSGSHDVFNIGKFGDLVWFQLPGSDRARGLEEVP
jgi:hypothetical protein